MKTVLSRISPEALTKEPVLPPPSTPLLTAGELPGGAAARHDHGNVAPVLPPDLQSPGLPGGTQHGSQVTAS